LKVLETYFARYAESHQHPINIRLHQVCVPLILWSILGLLHLVVVSDRFPLSFLGAAVVVAFYLYHRSFLLALSLGLIQALMIQSFTLLSGAPVFLIVFVLAWIGQFVGHKIEGKKPAFFEDLFFLLVGPGWVLKKLYF
jgi:uncharacterized membrane protein YGL010W